MQLILYSTEYCQLCEEAESLIYKVLQQQEYSLRHVDISESDELMERYAIRIPVLRDEQNPTDELDWPFDASQLLQFTRNLGQQ